MTPSPPDEPLIAAWSEALPRVLALLGSHERDLFRHELQRFCATARFRRDEAGPEARALADMLLESVRAARCPAALEATRTLDPSPAEVMRLCEHLLAEWLDALEKTGPPEGACTGLAGEPFFGPRLGGEGRAGAMRRSDGDESG